MHPDKLFIGTLKNLEEKIQKGDDDSVLQTSALLRKLLLDGNPLIHEVNRARGLKVELRNDNHP